ncbi:MAG TPA: FG-GAP repeat protein [Syntrophales bacterium]|nr:FG-GAP repeat protein [Syntrophales bacterium]
MPEKILTLPGTNYYQIDNNAHYDDQFGAAVAISGDYAIVSAPSWDPDEIANEEDIDDMDWGSGWIFKRDQGGAGNWGMLTQLTDSNPRYDPYGRNDHLGYAVAMDGDTCVMCSGETALSQNWSAEYGACAIYYQNEGGADNWGVKKWVYGHAQESNHYGYACAISGDYLIVGERAYGEWNGAAFIYYRDQGGSDNWGTVKTFTGYPEYAAFGVSVDIDESSSPVRVIVGADYNQNGHAGSAYIYEQGGTVTTWTSVGTKDGATSGDQFGHAVGICGDWAVVGAPQVASGGIMRGAVYVYLRDGSGIWNLSETMTPTDAADYDKFGSTLSIDGTTLLVGAPGDDPAGSVYVYTLAGTTWSYKKKLTGSDSEEGDNFGYFYNSVTTISVSGNNAIVGAPGYDTTHNDEGAAYLFGLQGGGAQGAAVNLLLLSD